MAPRPFMLQEFASFTVPAEQKEEVFEPEEAPLPPAPPPGLHMTEEAFAAALKQAEQKGREEGLLQGKADGMAMMREEMERADAAKTQAAQAALQATADALLARIESEADALLAQRNAIRAEMAGIVIAMGRKLAGQALQTQPLGAVQDMVEQCVEMFTGPMRVVIMVAEPLVEPMKQFMEFRMRDGVQIEIKGNPQMVAGDCEVNWPGGGAKRNQQEMEREIEAIILRGLAGKTEG